MRHEKVGSVMTTDVVRAEYGTPFKEVVRLIGEHRISGLPVIDDDEKVIGVISETDLLARHIALTVPPGEKRHRRWPARWTPGARRRAARAQARTAGGLMSTPPVTVHAEDTVAVAARVMAEHEVDRLPVLDEEDRLVGIVTRHDLVKVFLRPDERIRREVVDEVLDRALWLEPGIVDVAVTDGVVTLSGRMERRSETEILVSLARRIDGVVAVVDRLTHRLDDTRVRLDGRSSRITRTSG